jgi:hypothetical protein
MTYKDISANHYLYDKYAKQWERISDVLEGSDAVKDKGTTYLPLLTEQTDDEYASYKARATFFNMASRVFESNIGMLTRRTPKIDFPGAMAVYNKDDVSFTSFYELFVSIARSLLAYGRTGVLIDIRNDTPVPVTVKTENIIHWLKDKDTDELTSVTMVETKYLDGVTETEYLYHLRINEEGVYEVQKYIDGSPEGAPVVPTYKGIALSFIPLVCGNTKGIDIEPVKSPMIDIVDVNLSHYRTSADYEHGLHFVALPTPVFSGTTFKTGESASLGSSKGIVLPDKDAKAYYLEFQGQGLTSLQRALSDKQSQIALFSARLQDTNTKGSEAENTVRLRYSADSATLSNIALSTELVLKKVYESIGTWLGTADVVSVELNKDFLGTKLTPNELKELSKSLVDGAIDFDTFLYNMEKGEMLDPNRKSQPKFRLIEEPPSSEGDQTTN